MKKLKRRLSFLNSSNDKHNIFANYGGNLITAVISLLFIPVYIHYLGIESYGILGFFVTIQGLMVFLDLGLGVTINQEMAKYYRDPQKINYLNNLAFSLQIIYWIIGIICALFLFVFTPYFSTHWFKEAKISPAELQQCFMLMALTIAAKWPYAIYSSGLRGMQFQVLLNVHDLFYNLVKAIGSWLVLLYIDNSLVAFLTFQLIVIFAQTVSLHIVFWYKMPKPSVRKQFDKAVIKNIARYAAAMGVAAVLGSFVYQLDKLILSKMLAVEKYGYYILGFNLAILVNNITLPIYMAIFPNFTSMVHNNLQEDIQRKFRYYSKLVAGLVLPISGIMFFFAKELLFAWTNNMELATHVAPVLQLLIIATTLNAFMVMPHTLLLANKNVRFMLKSHIIAALVFIPLIFILASAYNITGGAIAIIILYAGYFFIQAFIIIKKYLPLQKINWYVRDIGYFLLVSVVFLSVSKLLLPMPHWGRVGIVSVLAVVWGLCTVICLMSIKPIRQIVSVKLKLS